MITVENYAVKSWMSQAEIYVITKSWNTTWVRLMVDG
jgi:hypothetical protein